MEMTTFEKIALELYNLHEEHYEEQAECRECAEAGDKTGFERVRRYQAKTRARIDQTLKVAELLGFDRVELENRAFEIAVIKASQEPIDLSECVPF